MGGADIIAAMCQIISGSELIVESGTDGKISPL
jgi:hypothetical protein